MRLRAVAFILGATACSAADVPSQQVVAVKDSAGVRLLSVPRLPDASGVTTVARAPLAAVGTAEGEAWSLFSGVVGACRVAGGNLLVADGTSREVRVFDERGSYVKTFGRRGNGPNEFAALSGLWCGPDKAYVYDWTTRRLTFLDAGAAPGPVVTIEPDDAVSAIIPVGRLSDGRLVTRGTSPQPDAGPIPGVRDTRATFLLHGVDGAVAGRVATVLDLEQFFMPTTDGQGVRIRGVPFGRETQATLVGDQLAIGTQREPEVRLYEADGRLSAIVRLPSAARTASAADVERELASSPRYRTVTAAIVGPRQLPFHGQLTADTRRRLWIQDYHVDESGRTAWTVVDLAAGRASRVRLPVALRILSITRDAIVGVATDEDGVEQVRVYPFPM